MKAIRYVGKRGCDEAQYVVACGGGGTTMIDALPNGGNVTLAFKLWPRNVRVNFSERARDLLDLGVCVYIADEASARVDAPDGWTRSFEFLFPVKDPEAWAAVDDGLAEMLSMLSGDQYRFAWPQRGRLPLVGSHRARLPRGFDSVCLFSGGIDSLLGAHQLLTEGRRVLLVGHQADSVTASAQSALFQGLLRLFPNSVQLVQSRVARSMGGSHRFPLPDKVEETHRPRSFLFLAIAASIAKTLGIEELYIPENGLIALNPPLQPSRLGSLSTRTAHPAFLSRLARVLANLELFNGALRNPFTYQSKTDMLRGVEPRLHPLLLRSVSCARPSRYNYLRVRHCGYCVACLYRRVAMIAGGLDRPKDYAYDAFRSLESCEPHKQIDFRALVQFARTIAGSTTLGRELLVLSHGAFSPTVGGSMGPTSTETYAPWTDMLKRWADDFLEQMRSSCSPSTKQIIGLPRRVKPKTLR